MQYIVLYKIDNKDKDEWAYFVRVQKICKAARGRVSFLDLENVEVCNWNWRNLVLLIY